MDTVMTSQQTDDITSRKRKKIIAKISQWAQLDDITSVNRWQKLKPPSTQTHYRKIGYEPTAGSQQNNRLAARGPCRDQEQLKCAQWTHKNKNITYIFYQCPQLT
jgi:hypothetical protein